MAGIFVVASVLLGLAAPAAAQEAKTLEPVVVTGTRVETPAEQVGASVTIIDGEEFETRHLPVMATIEGVEAEMADRT